MVADELLCRNFAKNARYAVAKSRGRHAGICVIVPGFGLIKSSGCLRRSENECY